MDAATFSGMSPESWLRIHLLDFGGRLHAPDDGMGVILLLVSAVQPRGA